MLDHLFGHFVRLLNSQVTGTNPLRVQFVFEIFTIVRNDGARLNNCDRPEPSWHSRAKWNVFSDASFYYFAPLILWNAIVSLDV